MNSEEDAKEAASPAPPAGQGGEHEEAHGHAVAAPVTADEIARRQLLGRMSIGVGVVCGAAISVPGVGFVVAPIFRQEPREWNPVFKREESGEIATVAASMDDFKIGETVSVVFSDASPLPWAGVTSRTAAWLRRVREAEFLAFSVNCAHLGCPVRWVAEAHLFMCPCHGGVYYEDGRVAAGPPPHPLTRYPVRVDETGQVQIRTEPIPIG